MEIVIGHGRGDIPRVPTGWPADVYYVHMLSREGMLEDAGNYTHRIEAVRPGCPAHLKNVQLRCKCSVGLSGAESTKQATRVGLCAAQGAPPAKPLASCSVFISRHRPAKDAVHSYQKVCFFFLL